MKKIQKKIVFLEDGKFDLEAIISIEGNEKEPKFLLHLQEAIPSDFEQIMARKDELLSEKSLLDEAESPNDELKENVRIDGERFDEKGH